MMEPFAEKCSTGVAVGEKEVVGLFLNTVTWRYSRVRKVENLFLALLFASMYLAL
jgi:hypothetical protein